MAHGYLFSKDTGFAKSKALCFMERIVASKTDAVIVMNEEDRVLAERYHLAPTVYFTRGMGVPKKELLQAPEEIRKELGAEGKLLLCFVGELSGRKNQELLIRGLARLSELKKNATLVLVGEGDEREALAALAEQLGVTDSVIFAGRRTNAVDFMRACDIYVSASKIEGLPFNIVEALSAGCKIVASDIKGHSDVLDGVGMLFESGNVEEFVKCVLALEAGELSVTESELLQRYRKYSKQEVFDNTLTLMKEALLL